MNKLDNLLKNKNNHILSVYFTAGYPQINSTTGIIESLEDNQADLIEIGIPFSDPVADGPVIQSSSTKALSNGMSLKKLFEQLETIAQTSKIPKLLMGYLNPVLQYGIEKFCKDCQKCGVDGAIIPDLPLEEYKNKYKVIFQKYGLHLIFLVSPQTSEKRLKEIAGESTAFLYAVSTNSTTGGELNIAERENYYKKVKEISGKPFLIGFGIKNRDTFQQACKFSNGAIIGTAFINALSKNGELKKSITGFINTIKN